MHRANTARVASSATDHAVQVHGGNGFAVEFPVSRILCDARILNIFEGAAEIQAQVIARRLLDGPNSNVARVLPLAGYLSDSIVALDVACNCRVGGS